MPDLSPLSSFLSPVQSALEQFKTPGVPRCRAAFVVGWEVAHLTELLDSGKVSAAPARLPGQQQGAAGGPGTPQTGQAGQAMGASTAGTAGPPAPPSVPAPAPPGPPGLPGQGDPGGAGVLTTPATGQPASNDDAGAVTETASAPPGAGGDVTPQNGTEPLPDVGQIDDASVDVQWAERAWTISSALNTLCFPTENAPPAPSVGSLTTLPPSRSGLAEFHSDMLVASAALEAETHPGPGSADSSDHTVPAGLVNSYEVGRLMAALEINGTGCGTIRDFTSLLGLPDASTDGEAPPSAAGTQEGRPGQPGLNGGESVAGRVHELLAGLHPAFPGGAAYAVSRHLEDWSAWLKGQSVDVVASMAPQPKDDAALPSVQAALSEQSRVWWSLLSGQALAESFTGALSWADAADHLLLFWTARGHGFLANLWRTWLGRAMVGLFVLVVVVFFAVVFLNIFPPAGSNASSSVSLVALIAAAVGSGGLLHVSRTQVQRAVSTIWISMGPPVVEAEVAEAIAQATRRLPGDVASGASPVATLSSAKARLKRAGRAGLRG